MQNSLMQKLVITGKHTEINSISIFGLIEEDMELSPINLAVPNRGAGTFIKVHIF